MEAFDGEESEVRTWDTGLQGTQGGTAKRQKDGSGPQAEGKAKRLTMPVEKPQRARPRVGGQRREERETCPSLLEAFGVHGATHSPPQLKAFCSLPCLTVVSSDRSGFVPG